MRFLYFLIFVSLLASGYFAYREGYLANVHPLLDPSAKIIVTREGDEADVSTSKREETEEQGKEEQGPGDTPSKVAAAKDVKDDSKSKSEPGSKSDGISEKERAKLEREEKDRLAREARVAEREAAEAARKAENEAREQHNKMVDQEVAKLEQQANDLQKLLREAEGKLFDQEVLWRQEKIKTRDVEKQELRDASEAYQKQIRAQMDQVFALLREKRREYK